MGRVDPRDVYAVVRLDSFRNFTPRPENVSIKKVHHSLSDAELQVRQLNGTAPTGTVYFIQRTTVATGTPRAPQRKRRRRKRRRAGGSSPQLRAIEPTICSSVCSVTPCGPSLPGAVT